MMRMGSWFTAKPKASSSSQSLSSLEQIQQFEDALRAMSFIMEDDMDSAEAGLAKGNSSFHKRGAQAEGISASRMQLGHGVVAFMRAALGFEPEVMREASDLLSEAETAAYKDQRHAQRDRHYHRSTIYPIGSEFALCQAEAQLMGAVVGVLNESLAEALKAFYKMRKAYVTLHAIVEAENKYMRDRGFSNVPERRSLEIPEGQPVGFDNDRSTVSTPYVTAPPTPEPAEQQIGEAAKLLVEAEGTPTVDLLDDGKTEITSPSKLLPASNGEQLTTGEVEKMLDRVSLSSRPTSTKVAISRPITPSSVTGEQDITMDVSRDPIDAFIHSGANLCFGLLLIIISFIPPAFGKVLYIIGVSGDREKGLKMLWQATKVQNVNDGLAGLVILGYYNGLSGLADIVPDAKGSVDDLASYSKERCEGLLIQMRTRYPKSHLWLLEEARMEAANKNLEKAIDMLNNNEESPLKQVAALDMFERSLDSMYLHRYEDTAEFFIKCVNLNNWSHALYYYIAGSAHVEMYRKFRKSDPDYARLHAKKATELLKMAPTLAGRKKFMARQLPFDVFVTRKIQKWEHRSTEWEVDFIDAIGVSPIEEMIYMWNGYKRMRPSELEVSLNNIAWSKESNEHWDRESLDEQAILTLLHAAVLRNLDRDDEAREILKKDILSHDRAEFKGHLKDDWTCPSAHYEMAVICWKEKAVRCEKAITECREWLGKAAKWEAYEMDARHDTLLYGQCLLILSPKPEDNLLTLNG